MAYDLSFSDRLAYDAGKSGISIPVKLKLLNIETAVDAKLDTGATDCIFSRRFGEDLGLEIEDGERILISTANSVFTAYGHEITLSVLDYELDVLAFFAEDSAFNRDVLGRRGFLDQFAIGLIDYDGLLYLSAYGQL
jgi:predicted aspartyl protease